MDLVSIIVPVYKVEQYLSECIDSILAQTYKQIEVILVDDGSPDGSPAICDEYALNNSNVKVVHKDNCGLSDARNSGLDIALGKYISFCDSDDIIAPMMIEKMISFAINDDVDIVGCESVMFDSFTLKEFPIYHSELPVVSCFAEDYLKNILKGKVDCSVCNKLFKRSVIGNCRFIKGRYNEDIVFQAEVISNSKTIVQINNALYRYRITSGSITHTFTEKSLDPIKNIEDIIRIIRLTNFSCDRELFCYKCKTIKTIATSIIRNRKKTIKPYDNAYLYSRSFLKNNFVKILKSPDFNMRFKIGVILILILR